MTRPTAKELHDFLKYDPATGKFLWLERPDSPTFNSRFAGKEAFTRTDAKGSKIGKINDRTFKAHRVAFAMVHGRWPDSDKGIDHINGIRSDNRIENLREVNASENNRNQAKPKGSKTPRVGVRREGDRWRAGIKVDNKERFLGRFESLAEAIKCREAAERRFGFHENHGRPPT